MAFEVSGERGGSGKGPQASCDRNAASGGSPEVTCKKIRHQWTPLQTCSDSATLVIERKTVCHLSCCQDPAQTVDRQDTRGLAAPLCHTKIGQSLAFLSSSGKPRATLGPQPQQHHHQEYHREAKGNSQIVSLCYCQEIQELLGLYFLLTPVKPILLRVLWWELLLSPTGLGP